MAEQILDAFWEGPFEWTEREPYLKPEHVLYALYGAHHVYGRDVLLYIGRTAKGAARRLTTHTGWVEEEYDVMNVRVASVGEISSWAGWDDNERYPKAPENLVAAAEALLIYAHQPAYNRAGKESLPAAKGFRLFNTGMIGTLLPEISYRYHDDEWGA